MSSNFQQALNLIRQQASNDTELGTAFENLTKIFLEHDATQKQEYKKVWHYTDWAKGRKGYRKKDIGIDLVAELTDGSGFCAVQCKCYQANHSISKADLDSFISASATPDFVRLLLVDTSTQSVGKNAQSVFDNLDKDYLRIQLVELEESRIDWLTYVTEERVQLHGAKHLRDHQLKALAAVKRGLSGDDRGKLIMACGTGKTFTSLKIAEDLAGKGKYVLYMVPSLALMSQTVREWKNDASKDFTAFSACSDIKVGKRKPKDDRIEVNLNDLAFPATTDAAKLAEKVKAADANRMTVVFSTYQSIDVISKAQQEYDAPQFDLIICDEAHRTTGATLAGDDESNFVRIHDNDHVKGVKRLYMTATPRIYGEKAVKKAEEGEVALASMDDVQLYGKMLFHRGFGWAVENNLLTDYKVVVLAVDEGLVSEHAQRSLAEGAELKLDDVTKMVGCYKALAKDGLNSTHEGAQETEKIPMKRAIAFCQSIDMSKLFAAEFPAVVKEYMENERIEEKYKTDLTVELDHVDGTFNAERRNDRLNWLKDDLGDNQCRVLTNARCLSEGVDVPSLDAIMFLHPRKSQIDVVQSVGRVMRKAEGKDLGYVILPIAVPTGVTPERALDDNERYKVVWQILNALRTHDERFDSTINKIGLGEDVSDRLEIVGVGNEDELAATTAVIDDVKPKPEPKEDTDTQDTIGSDEEGTDVDTEPQQMSFILGDLSQAIKAKIVEKYGTRDYWETWAADIAKIAQQHITRITSILRKPNTPERIAFESFLAEMRDDLNPEISESDAVEMLAQHLITKPVFDTLFVGNKFTTENAVSKAMETVLDRLHAMKIDTETQSLDKFYDSVRRRAADIVTSSGRQTLILELYDRFFRHAFPLTTKRLGIVYTPTEVVDFIIHSVNDVLQSEFNRSLGSKLVEVMDPFTGTGTFISRLISSGLIKKQDLKEKYYSRLHANEIVLLAYYIASINIESVYHDLLAVEEYEPFTGMVLTDTFQLYEQERDMIADLLPDNSERRTSQKKREITVVMGNPPYSVGQLSANDNAANVRYKNLDQRIAETYVHDSSATLRNTLYDSYIRAFRWASDRIGDDGVIGFVTNAGWIDGNATDGLRKHLANEFSKIYVFHLRGNQRTKGELSRKEGGKIFGSGSRTPIAITILVKNKKTKEKGQIWFYELGDYLDRAQKLAAIDSFKSIKGVEDVGKFRLIKPDENNDWVNQVNKTFARYIKIGTKQKSELTIFRDYSTGVTTQRDSWCYNFSNSGLGRNCSRMIAEYTKYLDKYSDKKASEIKDLVSLNPKDISWSRHLFNNLSRGQSATFNQRNIVTSLYRPFTKTNLYSSKLFNDERGKIPRIFPSDDIANLVIVVSAIGSNDFSCLMSNRIPDRQLMFNGQCFPHKILEKPEQEMALFKDQKSDQEYVVSHGISDEGFSYFVDTYAKKQFNKDDLFYYIYGLLHSLDYRERFQNNLSKELPRIPAVKSFNDFKLFSEVGRKLSELHVNYESVEPFPVNLKQGDLRLADTSNPLSFYRVEKMKFPKKTDKSVVFYNKNITMEGIPLEAYEYVVNGRSALEWVMERQGVKTDKASGIVNDPNDYANETMSNPAYPFELFQRVITVSLETMKIVKSLPKLKIK